MNTLLRLHWLIWGTTGTSGKYKTVLSEKGLLLSEFPWNFWAVVQQSNIIKWKNKDEDAQESKIVRSGEYIQQVVPETFSVH